MEGILFTTPLRIQLTTSLAPHQQKADLLSNHGFTSDCTFSFNKQEEPMLLHIQTSHHMGLHINACLFDAAAHHITCRRLGWPKHHLAHDVHIARPNKPTKAVSININCSPPASFNIHCLKWCNKPTKATWIKINCSPLGGIDIHRWQNKHQQ